MYCLSRKQICDYENFEEKSSECVFIPSTNRTNETCKFATKDFKRIIKETFSEDDFEEFAKQIEIYENNKFVRPKVRDILDTCYPKREMVSSIEDIERIFFKEYFFHKRKKE